MARIDLTDTLADARARIDAETLDTVERTKPMFERMVRKDARVRPDQDVNLTALAKTLMRRRSAKAERITENTLIRVAIDLLLARAGQLRGSTEADLLRAVTSGVPHSRMPGLPDPETSGLADSRTSDLRVHRSADLPDSGRSGVEQFGRRALPHPPTEELTPSCRTNPPPSRDQTSRSLQRQPSSGARAGADHVPGTEAGGAR